MSLLDVMFSYIVIINCMLSQVPNIRVHSTEFFVEFQNRVITLESIKQQILQTFCGCSFILKQLKFYEMYLFTCKLAKVCHSYHDAGGCWELHFCMLSLVNATGSTCFERDNCICRYLEASKVIVPGLCCEKRTLSQVTPCTGHQPIPGPT